MYYITRIHSRQVLGVYVTRIQTPTCETIHPRIHPYTGTDAHANTRVHVHQMETSCSSVFNVITWLTCTLELTWWVWVCHGHMTISTLVNAAWNDFVWEAGHTAGESKTDRCDSCPTEHRLRWIVYRLEACVFNIQRISFLWKHPQQSCLLSVWSV